MQPEDDAKLNPQAEPFIPREGSQTNATTAAAATELAPVPSFLCTVNVEGKKIYSCPICDEAPLVSEYVLRAHLRAKHDGEGILSIIAASTKNLGAAGSPPHELAGLRVAVDNYLADTCKDGSASLEALEAFLRSVDGGSGAALAGIVGELGFKLALQVCGFHVFRYSAEELKAYSINPSVAQADELRVARVPNAHLKLDSLQDMT
jgi:hypothetical protein